MQWLGFSCLIDVASNQETQTLSDSAGWEGDLSYRLHKLMHSRTCRTQIWWVLAGRSQA